MLISAQASLAEDKVMVKLSNHELVRPTSSYSHEYFVSPGMKLPPLGLHMNQPD